MTQLGERGTGEKERERRGVDDNNTRSYAGVILCEALDLQNASSSARGLSKSAWKLAALGSRRNRIKLSLSGAERAWTSSCNSCTLSTCAAGQVVPVERSEQREKWRRSAQKSTQGGGLASLFVCLFVTFWAELQVQSLDTFTQNETELQLSSRNKLKFC